MRNPARREWIGDNEPTCVARLCDESLQMSFCCLRLINENPLSLIFNPNDERDCVIYDMKKISVPTCYINLWLNFRNIAAPSLCAECCAIYHTLGANLSVWPSLGRLFYGRLSLIPALSQPAVHLHVDNYISALHVEACTSIPNRCINFHHT